MWTHLFNQKAICIEYLLIAHVIQDKSVVMSTTVCVYFRRKAVGIRMLRKDQGDLSSSYAAGNILQENYEDHAIKRDEAWIVKSETKNMCRETTVVQTIDV